MDQVVILPDHLLEEVLKRLNVADFINIINETSPELKSHISFKILAELKRRNLDNLSVNDLSKLIIYYPELLPLYTNKLSQRATNKNQVMTIGEIKEKLTKLGLSTRGSKRELVDRLVAATKNFLIFPV